MTWPASPVALICPLVTLESRPQYPLAPTILVEHVVAFQVIANPVVAMTGTSVIRSLTGFACFQVKEAMTHSWAAYEQFAWGFDELQPLTQEGKDSLGGLGATIVDSLDTLWMFDMQDEFGR